MKLKPIYKFKNSLLTRYVLINVLALIFIPILIPISFIASWGVSYMIQPHEPYTKTLPYGTGTDVENRWHKEALSLRNAKPEAIDNKLRELKRKYVDASLYWVDSTGTTHLQLPKQTNLPAKWSLEDTIAFMKNRSNSDPFTVVAFIGGNEKVGQGFMVLELPRRFLNRAISDGANDGRFFGVIIALLLGFFILLSYLFFRDIRKRLLRLEYGMTLTQKDGMPAPIQTGRPDEIGRLEQAFNRMVYQLEGSKKREHQEEELRKNLISHLSHDLRTPLTVLASHLYSLREEPLSEHGKQSLTLMETKITDLSVLMDHLLSYNLLSSGRYAVNLEKKDVLRIVRQSAAAWYPVWEKAGISPDIDLPEDEPLYWQIDEQGLRRVLDNLFQNLVRHAGSGGYVGITLEPWRNVTALVISDHGPGMEVASQASGAGLGLQIVDLLLREMHLIRETESSSDGTRMYIFPAAFLNKT